MPNAEWGGTLLTVLTLAPKLRQTALKRSTVLAALLALGLSPTNAVGASSRDVASTHRALTAADTALEAVIRTWPRLEASLRQLNRRFASECPGVAVGSPQSEPEQKLAYEVAGALWAQAYHADANIVRSFTNSVRPLSWSKQTLNRRKRQFLGGLHEMVTLSIPPLCADIRAWKASSYQTVPTSTLKFDQHVEAIDVELPSPRLAAPYVQASDRTLFRHVERLITRFEELEFTVGQRYWNILLETLGLNQ